MGKDQSKASDHGSANTVDPDALDAGGVYIGLSATNIKLEEALEIDDSGLLMIKYVVTGDGRKKMADGELRDKRTLKVLAAWIPNRKPVGQEGNQPGLYEIDIVDGAPLPQNEADDDSEAEGDEDTVDTGDADVPAPAFSDVAGGES